MIFWGYGFRGEHKFFGVWFFGAMASESHRVRFQIWGALAVVVKIVFVGLRRYSRKAVKNVNRLFSKTFGAAERQSIFFMFGRLQE